MSRMRGADTRIEVAVRRELWRRGYRYRKNVMSLPGRSDVVFPGARLVVFVDGDFWHGYRVSRVEAEAVRVLGREAPPEPGAGPAELR